MKGGLAFLLVSEEEGIQIRSLFFFKLDYPSTKSKWSPNEKEYSTYLNTINYSMIHLRLFDDVKLIFYYLNY